MRAFARPILALLVLPMLAACSRATPPPAAKLQHPIVLVGLDGADWQIIDPLIAQGRLPHLAALKERAAWGHMRSFEPILSPLLWTTAATGKPPDEHGIVDFLLPDPATGKRAPISSRSRKVKALWNIMTDRGLSTDVVAWWASWPAEPVLGRMISDRVAYSLFDVAKERSGLTWPASLMDDLESSKVGDETIGYDRVARFLDVSRDEFEQARRRAAADPEQAYKEPINHLTRILASTETYQRMALELLKDRQPDLFAIYYQGIDEVCHRFAHFMPPQMAIVSDEEFRRYRRAVEEFYVYQDELLGGLLASVAPASTVMVMSDHGFQNGPSRPTDGRADIEGKPGKWHRLYGIVLIAGEGIRPGQLDTATLYDVTPTVLALAGLPQARDMRGRPLAGADRAAPEAIASYEAGAAPERKAADAGRQDADVSGPDEEMMRNLASLGYIGAPQSAPAAPAAEPGTVTSHTNLAASLVQKGDLPGAETELRAALAIRPNYFPAMMTLAQVLIQRGSIEEALDLTRRAIAGTEDAEDGAYQQLAMLASRAGQAEQAANFLRALQRRRPRAAGIPTAIGVLAQQSGRPSQAEAGFREALAVDPASVEAMARLFQAYRAAGREERLEPEIRKALAVNEKSVLHHNWLGLILGRRGDAAGAEAEFRRALELAPDFGGTMANLGALYGRTGRLEEAASILGRALRIDPKNIEARVSMGGALAKLGRLTEAVDCLEEARRMGTRSTGLLNAIGLAYAQSGRKAEAIEALKESLTMSPKQPQVQALLSELMPPAS